MYHQKYLPQPIVVFTSRYLSQSRMDLKPLLPGKKEKKKTAKLRVVIWAINMAVFCTYFGENKSLPEWCKNKSGTSLTES